MGFVPHSCDSSGGIPWCLAVPDSVKKGPQEVRQRQGAEQGITNPPFFRSAFVTSASCSAGAFQLPISMPVQFGDQ